MAGIKRSLLLNRRAFALATAFALTGGGALLLDAAIKISSESESPPPTGGGAGSNGSTGGGAGPGPIGPIGSIGPIGPMIVFAFAFPFAFPFGTAAAFAAKASRTRCSPLGSSSAPPGHPTSAPSPGIRGGEGGRANKISCHANHSHRKTKHDLMLCEIKVRKQPQAKSDTEEKTQRIHLKSNTETDVSCKRLDLL